MKFKFTFFLALAWCSWAWGQANAGPDVRVCPGASATIGTTGFGNFCYHWVPATGLNDPNSPTPEASPLQTTTYTLTVVSEDLANRWTDQVTVTIDGIQRIKVTPKRCCWKKGETLKESDFDIVTTPSGLNGNITIVPSTAPFSYATATLNLSRATNVEEVTVRFTCDQAVVEQKVKITVVDEDFKQTVNSGQINTNKAGFLSNVCHVTTVFGQRLNWVSSLSGGVCNPQLNCTLDIPYSSQTVSKKCCDSGSAPGCVKKITKLNGLSGSISGGVSCYFPFAGVPGAASVNLSLQAGLSATPSVLAPGQIDCKNENNTCIRLGVSGNVGGGIAGCVGTCQGALNVVRVQGVIVGSVSPDKDIEFCWPSGDFSYPTSICLAADLEGSVTFFSGYSQKYKVVLMPKQCW